MASRIVPPSGEVVEATPRKSFSWVQKESVCYRQRYRCAACETLLRAYEFQIDHRIPIELGGLHEWGNWQALCVPCHKIKTRSDIKAIAKARRIRRKADPATRKAPSMVSRGFQSHPTLRRGMDGKVRERSDR